MNKIDSLENLFKALYEGKRVRETAWPVNNFIQLKNGNLINNYGSPAMITIYSHTNWVLFNELR